MKSDHFKGATLVGRFCGVDGLEVPDADETVEPNSNDFSFIDEDLLNWPLMALPFHFPRYFYFD